MKGKLLHSQQLIEIYRLREQGLSYHDIAIRVHMAEPSIGRIVARLNQYLEGKAPGRVFKNYQQAAKILAKLILHTQPEEVEQPAKEESVEGNLQRLADAFAHFEKELSLVIEAEASRRAEEKITEKQLELQQIKTHYERELTRVESLLAAAKQSNLVGFLRNKWAGK